MRPPRQQCPASHPVANGPLRPNSFVTCECRAEGLTEALRGARDVVGTRFLKDSSASVSRRSRCADSSWLRGDDQPDRGVSVEAVRTSLELTVPAEGYLEALAASPIAVPRVPTGALKVKELVEEGTIVEKGHVVVVFDDTILNIELANNKASFRSAERRIDKTGLQSTIDAGSISVIKEIAELERDNTEIFQLIDESVYSKLEILENSVRKEEAEETVLFAEASLLLRGEYYDIEERILGVEKGQVKGKIERVETSLASLVLRAPIGGMIVYKKNWHGNTAGVGDTLWPGNVVMSAVDPASTALKAYVLERDSTGVTAGAKAMVRIDALPNQPFDGTVTKVAEISAPIEQGSPVKYFEVQIELGKDNRERLRPGMKGTADIAIGHIEDAVMVPRPAIQGEKDHYFVVVETKAGTEQRKVTLGPGDSVRVSVDQGLEAGERVRLAPASSTASAPSGA